MNEVRRAEGCDGCAGLHQGLVKSSKADSSLFKVFRDSLFPDVQLREHGAD
jgi:hypothetical protein